MSTIARRAALDALLAIELRGRTAADALDRSRLGLADRRDRRLVTDTVYGVCRWRAQLDYLIANVTGRPVERLQAEVAAILRIGAYQRLHHSRTHPAAIVSDCTELVRDVGLQRATGLVNAVLRRIQESSMATLPSRPDIARWPPQSVEEREAALRYLSITLSHPRWLVERWSERIGFSATEAWLRFNNTPGPTCVRPRPSRPGARPDPLVQLPATAVPARYAPGAWYVPADGPDSELTWDLLRFAVQEEGSQLVANCVDLDGAGRVLDLCASPGGKTIAMRDRGAPGLLLVACDHRRRRVALLHDRLRRAHCAAGVVRLDAAQALPFGRVFDRVLLDAPCSGLGTLRRDPDLKWRRGAEALARFAETQEAMLGQASAVVRPGGTLLYATCSTEPEEDDAVVAAFLARHHEFVHVPIPQAVALPAAPSVIDEAGNLRTLPFLHGIEGFFAAALRRAGVRP